MRTDGVGDAHINLLHRFVVVVESPIVDVYGLEEE
jgi:hypothetical protein